MAELSYNDVRIAAESIGVPVAAFQAITIVESNGVYSTQVGGREVPLIRFEGHKFYARLSGAKLKAAVAAGLASPKAGAVKNPSSQTARYALLERAKQIDRVAALESCSVGCGQVMAYHWNDLGYASVDAFYSAMNSVGGQLLAMAKFIRFAGLVDELQRLDFDGFARGYNGANYRKYGYATKMRQVYQQLTKTTSVKVEKATLVRMGTKGALVREVQALLVRQGYALKVDGDFGPSTKAAVEKFQANNDLVPTGLVDVDTNALLRKASQGPGDTAGKLAVADLPEVKAGAAGPIAGALISSSADKLNTVADHLAGAGASNYLTLALYGVAGALTIGGLAYAAYGYWKSGKTYGIAVDA